MKSRKIVKIKKSKRKETAKMDKLVKTILWLLPALALEGGSVFLLRGMSDDMSAVAGIVLFVLTVPFFVAAMGQGLSLGALYAVWDISINVTHGLVGASLGERPSNEVLFALGLAAAVITFWQAARMSEPDQVGSFAKEGESADETFDGGYVALNLGLVTLATFGAAAASQAGFHYGWAAAFAIADVAGAPLAFLLRNILFGGSKKLVPTQVSRMIGYLPAAMFYTFLIRLTGEELLILGVVTSGMEVAFASIIEQFKGFDRLPKLVPVLKIIALTMVTGYLLNASY